MKCRDMDMLLSAYANKELDSAQSELVEKHLTSCNRCRENLAHFVESGRQLRSLKQTPLLPDIKPSIISRIITRDVKVRPRKRLRPVLGVMSVAIVVITLLVLHLAGFFIDPAAVVSRAYAATTKITTYYSFQQTEQSSSNSSADSTIYTEVKYDGPERYHIKQFTPGPDVWQTEIINYNGEIYYYADLPVESSNPDFHYQEWVQDLFKKTVDTLEKRFSTLDISQMAEPQNVFDYLVDIEQLPDEELDGLICFHYLGTVDKEKMATKLENSMNESDDFTELEYESLQSTIYALRHPESQMQVELWISKDDYLIRQMKEVAQLYVSVGGKVIEGYCVATINYRYNTPIIIQAPLTEDGGLEPGWNLYSDLIK